MLSRTADSLYWVSRYVERAEYLARILDARFPLRSRSYPEDALTARGWTGYVTGLPGGGRQGGAGCRAAG